MEMEKLNKKDINCEVESFKKENWNKAKRLSKKNNTNTLTEYKKLINFMRV